MMKNKAGSDELHKKKSIVMDSICWDDLLNT